MFTLSGALNLPSDRARVPASAHPSRSPRHYWGCLRRPHEHQHRNLITQHLPVRPLLHRLPSVRVHRPQGCGKWPRLRARLLGECLTTARGLPSWASGPRMELDSMARAQVRESLWHLRFLGSCSCQMSHRSSHPDLSPLASRPISTGASNECKGRRTGTHAAPSLHSLPQPCCSSHDQTSLSVTDWALMAVEGGGRRSMILYQWFLAVRLSVRPCDGWDEKRKERCAWANGWALSILLWTHAGSI